MNKIYFDIEQIQKVKKVIGYAGRKAIELGDMDAGEDSWEINQIIECKLHELRENIFIRIGKAFWFTLIDVNGKYKNRNR